MIGLEGLAEVCRATCLPVVAIGGLNVSNAAAALQAGAQGIAVVRDIFANPDAEGAARELRTLVDRTNVEQD